MDLGKSSADALNLGNGRKRMRVHTDATASKKPWDLGDKEKKEIEKIWKLKKVRQYDLVDSSTLKCLQQPKWLTGTVITEFMKVIAEQYSPEVVVLSSDFYATIANTKMPLTNVNDWHFSYHACRHM